MFEPNGSNIPHDSRYIQKANILEVLDIPILVNFNLRRTSWRS